KVGDAGVARYFQPFEQLEHRLIHPAVVNDRQQFHAGGLRRFHHGATETRSSKGKRGEEGRRGRAESSRSRPPISSFLPPSPCLRVSVVKRPPVIPPRRVRR